MPITVVVSQGQSANPAKRDVEDDLVAALLFEKGIEVTVVPNLYDLKPDGTGILALEGISGDMIVASWLFPRAAFWILDRNGIRGHFGKTLLEPEDEEEVDEENAEDTSTEDADVDASRVVASRTLPNRRIYCLDLRSPGKVEEYVAEIRRIASETSVKTFDLLGFIGGQPKAEQMDRFLSPSPGNVASAGMATENGSTGNGSATTNGAAQRVEEETARRWYPVIDFSRCTNCMECIDFCLFGVYGVDRAETILVEQPDNCRKGCPACSRVCPENAIIFPQHKTPAIAGSPVDDGTAFKIDLSKLFGAPDENPLDAAVRERDEQLMLAGREAVGTSVGVARRQDGKSLEPKDDLDSLIDQLDALDL